MLAWRVWVQSCLAEFASPRHSVHLNRHEFVERVFSLAGVNSSYFVIQIVWGISPAASISVLRVLERSAVAELAIHVAASVMVP